jgi:hypothetical protein
MLIPLQERFPYRSQSPQDQNAYFGLKLEETVVQNDSIPTIPTSIACTSMSNNKTHDDSPVSRTIRLRMSETVSQEARDSNLYNREAKLGSILNLKQISGEPRKQPCPSTPRTSAKGPRVCLSFFELSRERSTVGGTGQLNEYF